VFKTICEEKEMNIHKQGIGDDNVPTDFSFLVKSTSALTPVCDLYSCGEGVHITALRLPLSLGVFPT